MKYQITGFEVLGNMIAKVNELVAKGEKPFVTISTKSQDRSYAQNKVMHMWFADISKSTGNDIQYEAGRCKIQYFLPVLRRSDNPEADFVIELCEGVYRNNGYEVLSKALASSAIKSTSIMTVKEFTEALEAMREGEREHQLRDPSVFGYEL
ncbi:MAG: hypothetical protein ACRC9P_02075 [Bacteroides sp.]